LNKILTGFHDYENYKLQVKKIADAKFTIQISNSDMDPQWKIKFENIKKLYSYLQKELPNMGEHIKDSKKKRRDKIGNIRPLHEIYETIRINNINIKYSDNELNKIIEQLKVAKLNRTVFKDISLNLLSVCKYSEPNRAFHFGQDGNDGNLFKNMLMDSENIRLKDSSLINQLSQIRIKDDLNLDLEEEKEQLRLKSEKRTKFNAKLYNLLKRRNKIPLLDINLQEIQFLDSKFDEAKSTQISLNETSFLNLKTKQSPISSRTFETMVENQQLNSSINNSSQAVSMKSVQFNPSQIDQLSQQQPNFQVELF